MGTKNGWTDGFRTDGEDLKGKGLKVMVPRTGFLKSVYHETMNGWTEFKTARGRRSRAQH